MASNLAFSACKCALASDGKFVLIGHDHYGVAGNRTFGSLPRMFNYMMRSPFEHHLPALDFSPPNIESKAARGKIVLTL